jgi:hypothetical protein
MLAGVESPRHKAEREVKQDYGIKINDSTADQIVQIANQKYGKNVNLAVRSPEVRQMLGLYAAGTGQKMPQSALMPHAGSLVEQGGALYQAPTYQYGQAYAFQSSVPLLGPPVSGMYPNPGTQVASNTFQFDGPAINSLLQGQAVSVMSSPAGRAVVQQPGLIVT